MINNNTVIAVGGEFWDEEVRDYVYSSEVFSWNMTSGERTRLPDVPESFINEDSDNVYSCCLNDGTLCVMNGESWATLSQGGMWEMYPNLEGRGVKAIHLDDSICKIFVGSTWIDLPHSNEPNFNGLDINGMKIRWRLHSNHWIVK